MKSKAILVIASVLVIVGLLVGSAACAKSATTPAKTLKVGMDIALNWPVGLEQVKGIELDVDKINAGGGLDIGGEKYKIELVVDDHKMDEALAKTAAQKEIFQDGVKFMLGDVWVSSMVPLTEENKVILIAGPGETILCEPDKHYTFQGTINHTDMMMMSAYLANKFPELKTHQGVYPDQIHGRNYAQLISGIAKASGLEVFDPIFYPVPTSDLSAVGTKIKSLNPDIMEVMGGGPPVDGLVMKAANTAGWKGQIACGTTAPGRVLAEVAGVDAVEGLIALAWPTEFEPAKTKLSREWKADYVAKYGKWDDPELVHMTLWWVLKAGLEQAGSVDSDKVADVISSGMKYESIAGSGQMIPRLDLGNERTVETIIGDIPVKQIVGGEVKQIDTLSTKQVLDFVNLIYGKK